MVYKLFDKKSSGSGITYKPNYQLADELHKPTIKKLKKEKKSIFIIQRQYLGSRFS